MSRVLPSLQKRDDGLASGIIQQSILAFVPLEHSFEEKLDDVDLSDSGRLDR